MACRKIKRVYEGFNQRGSYVCMLTLFIEVAIMDPLNSSFSTRIRLLEFGFLDYQETLKQIFNYLFFQILNF